MLHLQLTLASTAAAGNNTAAMSFDWLKRVSAPLLEVVFPRGCPGCEQILAPQDGEWCNSCARLLLRATQQNYCPRCGMTCGPYTQQMEGCSHCHNKSWPLASMVRLGAYDSLIGTLVRKYKYGRRQELDRPLAGFLAAAIQAQPWFGEIDVLVPVPIDWLGRWRYGFHPVGAMTSLIGRDLNQPVERILTIHGKRRRQVGLSTDERARNVRGMFRLLRPEAVRQKTICAVDDVMTTGATLGEVARVLKDAGATRIHGAVLARAGHGHQDYLVT